MIWPRWAAACSSFSINNCVHKNDNKYNNKDKDNDDGVGKGNEASKQKTNYGTGSFACPPQKSHLLPHHLTPNSVPSSVQCRDVAIAFVVVAVDVDVGIKVTVTMWLRL